MIENAIRDTVLPFYGNTHTETSLTGRRTTALRELARESVRQACGAGPEHAVIFCGSGATGAIERFGRMLGLDIPRTERPLVLIGPHEHHSNDLIWREWPVDLVRIPEGSDGTPDLAVLERILAENAARAVKIASFSKASNVTGVITDLRAIAHQVHAQGGIMAGDHAASAPYLPTEMGESAPGANDHLDAVFLSPHKFPGGPGSSGVLVVARDVAERETPVVAGGGTVSYVTADRHSFVLNLERREEAGTPAIIGNIRAGMVLRLKELVGAEWIAQREKEVVAQVLGAWGEHPGIEILGSPDSPRLAIFAFNIWAGRRMLHHNLVVAMLNDIFGIQARGGCSCAGPYGHALLGISAARAARHEALVARGLNLFRPGWARLGITAFHSPEECAYIIDAVRFICDHAWILIRLYEVNPRSGIWTARGASPEPLPRDLAELFERSKSDALEAPDFADVFVRARELVAEAERMEPALPVERSPEEQDMRWFWWPEEDIGTARDVPMADYEEPHP